MAFVDMRIKMREERNPEAEAQCPTLTKSLQVGRLLARVIDNPYKTHDY